MTILNLTQHLATPEQVNAGVIDLPEAYRVELKQLLTFDELPTLGEISDRAVKVAELANRARNLFGMSLDDATAMIGGAPFLMMHLSATLGAYNIRSVFAFSKREVVETLNADGTVTKTAVFKHAGFVPAF